MEGSAGARVGGCLWASLGNGRGRMWSGNLRGGSSRGDLKAPDLGAVHLSSGLGLASWAHLETLSHWGWCTARSGGVWSASWSSACSDSPVAQNPRGWNLVSIWHLIQTSHLSHAHQPHMATYVLGSIGSMFPSCLKTCTLKVSIKCAPLGCSYLLTPHRGIHARQPFSCS